MNDDRISKAYKDFEKNDDFTQTIALVDIIKDLLATTRRQLNRIYIVLALSVLVNLAIVGSFLWYGRKFWVQ